MIEYGHDVSPEHQPCFGEYHSKPTEEGLDCYDRDKGLQNTRPTTLIQVNDSNAHSEVGNVQSLDTANVVIEWFDNLATVERKGKPRFEIPGDLKKKLRDLVQEAAGIEFKSRVSEHEAIAHKGRLFCAIRKVVQEYKTTHKKCRIPVEFTVLYLAKRVFGRCRQTLYTWKTVYETYGNDLNNLTDFTIAKLDLLAKLEEDKRDEWLTERGAELAEMDEDALKVLVKKPGTKRTPQGEFINGYRVIPKKTGTLIRGLQDTYAVEQEKLKEFLSTLTQGSEPADNVDASPAHE
ncbi:MAG: hypothetical protein ACLQPD_18250, partial [Desulfomonilaceae bacterium]